MDGDERVARGGSYSYFLLRERERSLELIKTV